MFSRILSLMIAALALLVCPAHAQLTVTPGQTAATLANTLSGGGVVISNAVLNCPSNSNGTFSYAGVSPILAIPNGIILTNGTATAAIGAEPPLVTAVTGAAGDPDMLPYLPAGAVTYDACILEFDVVPSGDTVSFNYQFGSEEYRQAVCTNFNDFFAFFISGPGITGLDNMALVPGTNIPVEVNSINNGVVGTAPGANIANCTSLGPGSPFLTYYIDNTGGADLSYKGYTTKLRAFHAVTPCQTYHLKLSIVDVGNRTHDSGVFLEANSLSSNGFLFSRADSIGNTINGVSHTIVKSCNPGTVTVVADHAVSAPETVNLVYSGSAVQGVDISALPTSLAFGVGSTTASFPITLLSGFTGPKTLTISIFGTCGYADVITLTLLDTPVIRILTPDTAVCPGQAFAIRTVTSPGLSYSWSPAGSLSSAAIAQPVATPMVNTVYTLSATYANAGCPTWTRTVGVHMTTLSLNLINGDSVFCTGTYYTFKTGSTSLGDLFWSFVPGDTVKGYTSVKYAWGNAGVYNLTVGPVFSGCGLPVVKTIRVYPTPFIYLGADTAICPGSGTIVLYDDASTLPSGSLWLWSTGATSPAINVADAGLYYATVSANGCIASDTVHVAPDCFAAIPNAFTPNGDGVNDYFFPRQLLSSGLTEFNMTIYNRWGQLVFQTRSLNGSGWDGKYNNEPQPSGVFIYQVEGTFKDGNAIHKTGNVSLLR